MCYSNLLCSVSICFTVCFTLCFCVFQVEALKGFRAVDIACGSGDAQTLCITEDTEEGGASGGGGPGTGAGEHTVWSWGDGDYGKLGRGGSDGCKVPMKMDTLQGCGVCKVECGSQFSVALTKSGAVYTWLVDNDNDDHSNGRIDTACLCVVCLQG